MGKEDRTGGTDVTNSPKERHHNVERVESVDRLIGNRSLSAAGRPGTCTAPATAKPQLSGGLDTGADERQDFIDLEKDQEMRAFLFPLAMRIGAAAQ